MKQTSSQELEGIIRQIIKEHQWKPAKGSVQVSDGATKAADTYHLSQLISYAVDGEHLALTTTIAKVSTLKSFIKNLYSDASKRSSAMTPELFLLSQHDGTPFIRFEIKDGNILGKILLHREDINDTTLYYMIRDLAREGLRFKHLLALRTT